MNGAPSAATLDGFEGFLREMQVLSSLWLPALCNRTEENCLGED